MSKRDYITTAIPYVNARPHIGFALELVQADAIARYRRLLGSEVRFQTGTDENAFKNVQAAREKGLEPREFVDRNSQTFQELCQALVLSHDVFVRTTEPYHARAVHAFWRRLRAQDVYAKDYAGLYCAGCEDFYLEKDLVNGLCPDHGSAPAAVRERNHFFRLSAYQAQVESLLANNTIHVVPAKRKNEVLQFVRGGLQDFSISRAVERSGGWGIPVPDDPSQVVYVWVDALINYLSGLAFGSDAFLEAFWRSDCPKVHVIGKNVWKFHAVYWPALLLSAGLPLPNEIVVHGFLTAEGQKISKSRGNTVDPLAAVAEFGASAVRYYLLRAVSPFEDSDFSSARLKELYNADLANGLGNLVSRIAALCARCRFHWEDTGEAPEAPERFHAAMQGYEFNTALHALWTVLTRLNVEITEAEPWKTLRCGEETSLRARLNRWVGELHRLAYWLEPFLPGASARIRGILFERPIVRCEPLFPRIR
jgi:methionyl-tRNA synthetase